MLFRSGIRNAKEVIDEFTRAQAAVAPIYDIEDILEDPQVNARNVIVHVQDPLLGLVRMQNVIYHLSETPGQIQWTGRPLGADTSRILSSTLGMSQIRIDELAAKGVIRLATP